MGALSLGATPTLFRVPSRTPFPAQRLRKLRHSSWSTSTPAGAQNLHSSRWAKPPAEEQGEGWTRTASDRVQPAARITMFIVILAALKGINSRRGIGGATYRSAAEAPKSWREKMFLSPAAARRREELILSSAERRQRDDVWRHGGYTVPPTR